MQHFVALQTFTATVRGHSNRYLEGYGYCARDDDDHAELHSLLPEWVAQGKIELVEAPQGLRVSGAGIVSAKEE